MVIGEVCIFIVIMVHTHAVLLSHRAVLASDLECIAVLIISMHMNLTSCALQINI
jgi:hypothetical protein